MDNRVELCCHTKMSNIKGINFVEEYINEAIKRGCKQLAITDINSTQSFFEANDYLKSFKDNKDFKIIYGSELRFKNSKDSEKIFAIYIYVKEQKGLKNLYELISKAYRNVVDGMPVIYKNDLIKYRDGLLYASIGRYSEVYKSIDNANINSILNFYDFIGIEPNESNKFINVKERLELNSINKNNYQNIYLIFSEIVKKSNELGYEVGNRGGVGNSFVAYLLGIVNYNPIEYNLLFEIFAGKNYDKEPDIDLNVEKEVKEKIISHLQKKYGKEKLQKKNIYGI